MAPSTNPPAKPEPAADEHVLVRLADTSHFDQWCTDFAVFTRGAPPVSLSHTEAERIVADAAGCLVMEESA